MTREAKILTDTPSIIGGGDAAALARQLQRAFAHRVAGVVSFGLCGALDPGLKVGDLVVGRAVAGDGDVFEADLGWVERLAAALPTAIVGSFAKADRPVASANDKAQLRDRTGAVATDLESHVAATIARRFGVPFVVLRAVSDAANRTLPHAAQVGLGADGRPAIGPVLQSLGRSPWQLPSLIRTALEAEDGFHALERARDLLGPGLGGPDLG
jgi:hopanoid-associated phosphorylase